MEKMKEKIIITLKDNVLKKDLKNLMDKVTPLFDKIFEEGKAESKNFPKIQKEFDNTRNSYFISTKDEKTTTDEIKDKIKIILTKGLMKKTDKEESEMRDIIDKEYDNLIKGTPLKIEHKATHKKSKKREGTLFKVTFTNKKINISGQQPSSFFGSQLLFGGIPSYNSGKDDKSFLQISREFPTCSKQHIQKLGEISFKIRKKNKGFKTRIALDKTEYIFKLEVKRGDNVWQAITECKEFKAFENDILESNSIPYVPYTRVNNDK